MFITAHKYTPKGGTSGEIAASVEEGLRTGALHPGQSLPTVRGLAAALSVSPATVAAAYRTLQIRGLVCGRGRRGTRVTWHPPLPVRHPASVPPHLRNLADGNPDAALLPRLRPPRSFRSRLYGGAKNLPELMRLAASHLRDDGVAADHLAILGGGLDAVERVLQSHLRPGDRVAVEDPGYTGVLDLVTALGLVPEPMALDESGPRPELLEKALRAGARAVIVTPRAQNPSGAALDAARARALRELLDRYDDVLILEDDHAGPVAGHAVHTLCQRSRPRWAVVRSVSKSLGPDLRLAILAGDPVTVARVDGRQALGAGWVSQVLQSLVASAWADPRYRKRVQKAAETYTSRREALLAALARRGIRAQGRSGLNVWVPVPEEAATVTALAQEGWAVRPGETYRLRSAPAVRITISTLFPQEAQRLADVLSNILRPGRRTATA